MGLKYLIMEEEVKQELSEEERKIKELEEKVLRLESINRAVNERYVALQRELEYQKERYRRDLEELRKYGYEKLALELLEVVDNFERAFSSAKDVPPALLQGFEMIYKDLLRILEKHGIREIEVEGKPFDPYLAEAVEKEFNSHVLPDTVVKVIRKGYYIHDKVLRPARVVVSVPEEEEIT